MSVLCDRIEEFIVAMLNESDGRADVKRNELADHFGCAPSQISYVITTRFCPMRGYVVQSRRGGGGYVRITRVDKEKSAYLADVAQEQLGEPICMRKAEQLVRGLASTGCIEARLAPVMLAAVSPQTLRDVPEEARDAVRSQILASMLLKSLQ